MENTSTQNPSYSYQSGQSDQSESRYKKRLLLVAIGIVLYLVGVYVYKYLTDTRVVISSEDGAEISIAFGQNEAFESIGKSSATYTKNGSLFAFIRAEKDGRVTQKYIAIEDGERTEISLPLEGLVRPSRVADVAMSYLFIEDGVVLGINPDSRSISRATLGGGVESDIKYLNMPYVNKVHWYDSDNFIFNSSRHGVGAFIDGSIAKRLYLSGDPKIFGNFSQFEDRPLVLLGLDGIYSSSNQGRSVSKLINVIPDGSVYFSSNMEHILLAETMSPETHEGEDRQPKTSLRIYSYSGDMVHQFIINDDIGSPVNIAETDNHFVLLTDRRVVFVDKDSGDLRTIPFHASTMEDLVVLPNGKLLLFGSDGLWFFDETTDGFMLAAGLAEGEEYVPNSLGVRDNTVHYSVQVSNRALRNPNRTVSNSVYRFDLN